MLSNFERGCSLLVTLTNPLCFVTVLFLVTDGNNTGSNISVCHPADTRHPFSPSESVKVCTCVCASEWEAGLLAERVSRQESNGLVWEPKPLLGVRAERMKPVIREVKGRKLSAGESIVLGAGGWDGSLVPQITWPPAVIVA